MKIFKLVSVVLLLILLLGCFVNMLVDKKEVSEIIIVDKQATDVLIVYTTVAADILGVVATEYEHNYSVPVQIKQMTEAALVEAISTNKLERGALVIAAETVLEKQKGSFMPLISEQGDLLLRQFREIDGLWTGLWFDPIVFVVNRDNVSLRPERWDDLDRKDNNLRLGIADFLLSDNMALPLYYSVAEQGEEQALEYWRRIHPRVTQYAKFPATPVRMVGMGEADVAIVFQSEALRYLQDGFPISVIYPEPTTPYVLIGVALVPDAGLVNKKAVDFVEWLMLDTPQHLLEMNRIFWISVHPDTLQYRRYATRMTLAEMKKPEVAIKKQLLDNWVRKVRLGTN